MRPTICQVYRTFRCVLARDAKSCVHSLMLQYYFCSTFLEWKDSIPPPRLLQAIYSVLTWESPTMSIEDTWRFVVLAGVREHCRSMAQRSVAQRAAGCTGWW